MFMFLPVSVTLVSEDYEEDPIKPSIPWPAAAVQSVV